VTAQPRLPYLPGLDGVRAIAVVAVLLFHLPAQLLPGGFLGVDVFFVLSGFLITSLLLAELERTGGIAFKQFYLRRARRLLPALLAVLAVSTVLVLTVARDAASVFRQDAIAALTYTTNWWYIIDDRSYFEVLGRPPLLQHLWSLGIEEQFYLVWPTVALFAWRRWGGRGVGLTALAGVVVGTALMAGLAVAWDVPAGADSARLYFGADTHSMTVLTGAALAVVWRPVKLPRTVPRSAQVVIASVGLLALTALVAIFVWATEESGWLYRGGFLAVALVTAVLVATASHPAARFGVVLGTPVLRWLGTRSYGIYLWHWPIFLVTRPDLDLPYRGWATAATSLTLTFLVAEASYRWIEMPVRRGALGRWWAGVRGGAGRVRSQGVAVLSAMGVTLVVAVIALWSVPAVNSATYLGGASQVGAGELTAREKDGASGGGRKAGERKDPRPYWERPITVVGDSVVVGARAALESQFDRVVVDGAIGRQPVDIADRVRERLRLGRIGDVLVLQTGTNGAPDPQGFPDFLQSLKDLDLVVVTTVRSEVPWMDRSNAVIERAVSTVDNAVVADWAKETVGNSQYLYPDGTHLTPRGQAAYARLVDDAIRAAYEKEERGR
jgi:peptidoglycan/LPS O-acetylase OafA/YrhL